MPTTGDGKAYEQLIAENAELCARLAEAEETLHAIRSGEVDALMVAGPGGDQVFTLSGADRVYRELIENMSEGALTLTADGVILYANRRFAEMVKTPLEKVIGAAIDDWLAPDGQAALRAFLQKNVTKRSAELTLAASNGEQIFVNLSMYRLSLDGLPDAIYLVATDLTERQQRIAALAASEEKFQYVFENSVIAKSITLPSGEITVNKAFCKMLGYTRAELAARTWQELTHPDDIALTERMLAPLLAGSQDTTNFTKRYLHKDGSIVWVDVGTALRRDKEGKPQYFVTSINDITRRRQAEENLRQSEALLRLVADSLPAFVAYVNAPALCYQFVNRQYASSFQLPREEIIGQPISSILSQANFEFAWPYIERALQGERCSYENAFSLAEGWRWLQVNFVPSLDQNGKVNGIVVLSHDLTEHKQTEEALREAEERFHSMFERHHAIMLLIDPHSGAITDANMAATQFYGYSLDELRRMNIDAINALSPEEVAAERARALAERQNYFVFPHRLASGEIRTVEVHSTPIAVGEQQLLFSIIHDITARKQVEAELAASQSMYKLLAENSSDAISLIDAEGKVVYISPAYARRLGFDESDLLQLDTPGILQLIHPDDRAVIAAEIERGRELKLPTSRYEYRIRTTRGDYVWLEDVLRRDFDDQGQFVRTIVNSRIITERKQVEDALRESEEKWHRIFELLPVGVSIVDANNLVSDVNQALGQILKLSMDDLLQGKYKARRYLRADQTLMSPEEFPSIRAVKEQRIVRNVEIGVETEDGSVIWTSVTATPLPSSASSAMVTVDITGIKQAAKEHARLQEQLAEAQKMELVGRLAGGIAHEFNNMLAGIMLRTELLLHTAEPGTPLQRGLTIIYSVSQRAAEMVQSLLGFARKQMIAPRVLDLNAVVEGLLPMLHNLVGEEIAVVWLPGARLWAVKIDPTQLDQILINLCANARDAINGVGTITIETSVLELAHAVDVSGRDIPPDVYVMPVSYTHLRAHETVLLVEDEAIVLQMAIDALEFLDYTVIAAATPAAAIQMMESHAGTVDLLMTDVVMPLMNGAELAEHIAVIQPGIQRLFISGYPADIVAQRGARGDDVHFLQKPFTLQELATKVRDVLADAAPIDPG